MPNWCTTEYRVVGDSAELKQLYDTLNSVLETETPAIESDFGRGFLGCVIEKLGGDYNDFPCRGEIYDLELYDDLLCFKTSTAWVAMTEMWDFVISKFPNLNLYYLAEEFGCEYFVTNDENYDQFQTRYFVDVSDAGESFMEYYADFETLKQDLNQFLSIKKDIKNYGDLVKHTEAFNKRHKNKHIYLQEVEIIK